MDSFISSLWPVVGYVSMLLFIISIAWMYEYKKRRKKSSSRLKYFEMDEKPLTSQTLFWLAISMPFFSFCYFGAFSWYGKPILFNADGFERFIKISTLPLGLLSLSIPLTAVINNIHRTIQTNKQIEETTKKNISDLYYSHKKFFFESMKDIVYIDKSIEVKLSRYTGYKELNSVVLITNINLKIKKYHYLYDSIYKSKPYNYDPSINVEYMDAIASAIDNIDKTLSYYINKGYYNKDTFNQVDYAHCNNLLGDLNKHLFFLLDLVGVEFNSRINRFENTAIAKETDFFSMMDSIHFLKVINPYSKDDFLVTNIYSDDIFRVVIKYLLDIVDGIIQFSNSFILDLNSYNGIYLILNDKSIKIFDVLLKKYMCFCEATTKNISYMDNFSNITSTQ